MHRASETEVSQSWIEPRISCTAGEHSMQRAIRTALLTIRNLGLYYYSSPQGVMMLQALDWGSWLSLTWTRIYLIGRVEVRIAWEGAGRSNLRTAWELHHVGVTTMQRLDQGHLHPLHRASETKVSQLGIEPGTSCTAGEHTMQRAIRMSLLTVIGDLGLYYYKQ
jgi:hypothetical protein